MWEKGDAQECDHEQVFNGISKKYIPVRDVSTVQWAMREAYRVARATGPARLWWISIVM